MATRSQQSAETDNGIKDEFQPQLTEDDYFAPGRLSNGTTVDEDLEEEFAKTQPVAYDY